MGILIRDNESKNKKVREYGTNRHDALMISNDGKCLYYENLQNGDGSMFGAYTFVLDDEKTPEESDSPDAFYGMTYANIGGFNHIEKPIHKEKECCFICPRCGSDEVVETGVWNPYDFCPRCGCKLDWSDVE